MKLPFQSVPLVNGIPAGGGGTGSGTVSNGTVNTLAKYTALNTVGNSSLTDDGTTLSYTGAGTTGVEKILGLTSGSFGFTGVDAMARNVLVKLAAQTVGDANVNVPDLTGTDRTMVLDTTAQTMTNKRVTARKTSIVSNANPTVNTDNCDVVNITALAADVVSMTTNLSGTPADFDQLEYRILDDATPRNIAWGAKFLSGPVAWPVLTTASKALHAFGEWDAVRAGWVCLSTFSDL